MRRKWIVLAPLVILGAALFIAVGGVAVQQLWNWLLPSLFGFPRVSFWQGLGLLALCRILFGGFRLHGSSRSRMTPDERERFRQRMRERFGFGQSNAGTDTP